MVCRRALVVAALLSGVANVVGFVAGGSSRSSAAAMPVKLEGGGTKTPIRAITHPQTHVKEIPSVSTVQEFDSLLVARPKQVSELWRSAVTDTLNIIRDFSERPRTEHGRRRMLRRGGRA